MLSCEYHVLPHIFHEPILYKIIKMLTNKEKQHQKKPLAGQEEFSRSPIFNFLHENSVWLKQTLLLGKELLIPSVLTSYFGRSEMLSLELVGIYKQGRIFLFSAFPCTHWHKNIHSLFSPAYTWFFWVPGEKRSGISLLISLFCCSSGCTEMQWEEVQHIMAWHRDPHVSSGALETCSCIWK